MQRRFGTAPKVSSLFARGHGLSSKTWTADASVKLDERDARTHGLRYPQRVRRPRFPCFISTEARLQKAFHMFWFVVVVASGTMLMWLPLKSATTKPSGRGIRSATKLRSEIKLHSDDHNRNGRKPFQVQIGGKYRQAYGTPGASIKLGDTSDSYKRLRRNLEIILPPDQPERSLRRTRELAQHSDDTQEKLSHGNISSQGNISSHKNDTLGGYDIFNCPEEPPQGYPHMWNLYNTILHDWPSDETKPPVPRGKHASLCVFHFEQDLRKALRYQHLEVPYILFGDPHVAESVERWNHPGYLDRLLGDALYECQESTTQSFLYFRDVNNTRFPKPDKTWTPPYQDRYMSYREWLAHDNNLPATNSASFERPNHGKPPHWYYLYLIACGTMLQCQKNEFLFDELGFFQPNRQSPYIVDSNAHLGIHCRFGHEGVTAVSHYDKSHNHLVVLQGRRRYILMPPDQCDKLALFERQHPSARHSSIDWSNPDLEAHPQFQEAMATELILQPGQVLFLPGFWFHYTVSLEQTIQCNAWSGRAKTRGQDLAKCGFGPKAFRTAAAIPRQVMKTSIPSRGG